MTVKVSHLKVSHLTLKEGVMVFHAIGESDSWHNFVGFLGETPQYLSIIDVFQIEQRAYDRLQMLLGPHGHTIAKAWLALLR